MTFEPTRAAGLARLAEFVPRAGRDYAAERNTDRGPGDRSNVSTLSPWVRHRLVTEREVVEAVLQRHSLDAASKFVDASRQDGSLEKLARRWLPFAQ